MGKKVKVEKEGRRWERGRGGGGGGGGGGGVEKSE